MSSPTPMQKLGYFFPSYLLSLCLITVSTAVSYWVFLINGENTQLNTHLHITASIVALSAIVFFILAKKYKVLVLDPKELEGLSTKLEKFVAQESKNLVISGVFSSGLFLALLVTVALNHHHLVHSVISTANELQPQATGQSVEFNQQAFIKFGPVYTHTELKKVGINDDSRLHVTFFTPVLLDDNLTPSSFWVMKEYSQLQKAAPLEAHKESNDFIQKSVEQFKQLIANESKFVQRSTAEEQANKLVDIAPALKNQPLYFLTTRGFLDLFPESELLTTLLVLNIISLSVLIIAPFNKTAYQAQITGQSPMFWTPRLVISELIKTNSVLMAVAIGGCLLAYLAMVLSTNLSFFPNTQELLNWGALSASNFNHGEYWRLLTAIWIHANPWHLVINMVVLYLTICIAKDYLAPRRLVVITVAASVMAGLYFVATQERALAMGMSAAIIGIFGALSASVYAHEIKGFKFRQFCISILFYIIPCVGMTYLYPHSLGAHLMAWVTGLLVGAYYHWRS